MDGTDIEAMASGLPLPKGGGGLLFKQGVINPWRVIGDYEIFIFTGGEARMTVDQVDYPCPDGSFVLMRPGRRHLSVCLGREVFVRWMHFDWTPGRPPARTVFIDGPFAPLPEAPFETPSFYRSGIACGRLDGDAALELHDRACSKLTLGSSQSRRLARAIFLEELLTLLGGPEQGSSAGAAGPDKRLAFEAMRLLRELSARPHREGRDSLQSSLRSLGRDYAHVERCFKRHFGTSPKKYLAALRIDRAMEMLLETSLNVSEIADALGYDDPGFFSRQFAARAGLSPAKFRDGRRAGS